ncbi:MAG: M3 family oligoendopeptidase [Anaerolineales bacterium]|nr:M3 family oligoendopeptidase [Anaerolineales bacterium]
MTNTFTQQSWSLEDLYPGHDTAEYQQAREDMHSNVEAFQSFRGELNDDISRDTFFEIVQALEELTEQAQRISSFAFLWFTEDTQDQAAQALRAQIEQLMADMHNKTMFFELWWKKLDQEHADRLMEDSGDYRYWLEEMRHFTPYTLSEPEEKVINIKDVTGYNALVTLYDSITNRYTFTLEVDGEEKELTRGELMVYVRHHDPDLRAAAYQELYRVYEQDSSILGQIYQTIARDWRNENVDLRDYDSPISVRNLRNDIPDQAVDTLLDVCEANAPLFQRFFKLKAKWLEMDRIRRYDVYAPVAKSDKTYEFNEAVEMVLDAFDNFEPRIADLAQRVVEEDHIDSEIRKGKQSGAFCASVTPDLSPWVKLNYQGRADDVATMAHELGHAIHAMLASDHNVFTFHSKLPLAENASTFGEMLLIDRLLEQEKDPAVRRDILFRQMDDAYATIIRQAFFALFEREAHEMIKEGAMVDEIAEAYMENLKTQFGDSLTLSEDFKWEWVLIPHFYHYPFYVYAYAFGQLLVLSLYKRYREEGESFKPGYLKILEAGGSRAPVEILSEADIDITDADFWQGGFDVIESMVEELEALPIE